MTASFVLRNQDGKDRTRLTGLPLIFKQFPQYTFAGAVILPVKSIALYSFIFLSIFLTTGTFAGTGDSLPADMTSPPLRIAHVYYKGNRVTKDDVIKTFARLDTGMLFDSLTAHKAVKRLEATGLFLKAAVISLKKNDAVDVYIIVKEPPYFGIFALDFTPYCYRYGQIGTWYYPLVGVEHTNLRGRMESLRISVRIWDWRSIALNWTKPLLPSPYFIGLGGFADYRPDNALTMDRLEFAGSLTAGRRCFARSKIFASVIPDFQRRTIWTETYRDTAEFYQAFVSTGWYTDRRSPRYDPARGWSFFFETRSNTLYHQEASPLYVQFTSDIKAYHRGLFNTHKVAYHVSMIDRTNDAGIQNRLVLGGLSSVRGYSNYGIDLQRSASHSFQFSCEYRFPIYQLPPMAPLFPQNMLKLAGILAGDMSEFAPRLDGGFIFDYGKVSRNFEKLFSRNNPWYRSGTDFGIGLRLMEPHVRHSVCMDIVWIENPLTQKNDFYAAPSWQLYLDLNF
jgi:hypothetical protein